MKHVTITLERTRLIVEGYDEPPDIQGHLYNLLCVYDSKIKSYVADKRFSYQGKEPGTYIFPRMTDIYKITSRLDQQGYRYTIQTDSNREVVTPQPFTNSFTIKEGVTPKDRYQTTSIAFLTNPLENDLHMRLLSLPVGRGKTYCAIAALIALKVKTLIVVPNLVAQWFQEIYDKTTIQPDSIYTIKDNISTVTNLLEEPGVPPYDIYIATLRTLANACRYGLYEKLCNHIGVGLKIVDEFHIAPYTNSKLDIACQIAETIYLTATARRSNRSEDYIFQLAYKFLPQYGGEVQRHNERYLNCIYVFYDTNPQYYEIHQCTKFYGFDTKTFAKHIFLPKNRPIIEKIIRWAISTALKKLDLDEKIVIILECKVHVAFMQKLIKKWYPQLGVGDYSSNVKQKEKQDNLNNTIIISTNSSFGTGSDLKGKLRVLINTMTYESPVTANQLPGRLRNIPGKSVYYIDLVNKGYKRTYEHYAVRSKIINKYAKSVTTRTYGVDL
jgi:hypothetical protein